MRRNRLKNIINKSKEFSNKQQLVGDSPFEQFKNSLPEELESFKGDNYRLEAAWKAYGSPKNYEEAVWLGLVNPQIPGKMPSIGYNEESDEYEYLNTGKENDIVAKDIRVWDNDVIPLVKELKLGGYVRTFNEEKNCWTYSKNPQKGIEPSENNEQQVIDYYKSGGKSSKKERKYKTYEEFKQYLGNRGSEEDYDLKGAYNDDEVYFDWEEEENNNPGKGHFSDKYKLPNHPTFSIDSKYSNSIIPGGTWEKDEKGNWSFKTSPWVESQHSLNDLRQYFLDNEPGITLIYQGVPYFTPQAFKQGGQMNVIPEGALHARKNNMELAKEGEVTHKGIPVVDNQGEQQAEIERNEIIFTKETTDKIEGYYKKFKDDSTSTSEKDELAIKCGKFLVDQILNNTDDKTGLIEEVKQNI